MKTATRRAKWAIAFAVSLVYLFGIAPLANRVFDVEQDILLFPTSYVYVHLPSTSSDVLPLAWRIFILGLHLLIWTIFVVVIWTGVVALARRRENRQ